LRATEESISEQRALRAELITTKVKADRAEQAGRLLDGVDYARCPQCGTDIAGRSVTPESCSLCGSVVASPAGAPNLEAEALRRELNDTIDQISDSIDSGERALAPAASSTNSAMRRLGWMAPCNRISLAMTRPSSRRSGPSIGKSPLFTS